jgi:hypothetical protein
LQPRVEVTGCVGSIAAIASTDAIREIRAEANSRRAEIA